MVFKGYLEEFGSNPAFQIIGLESDHYLARRIQLNGQFIVVCGPNVLLNSLSIEGTCSHSVLPP